MQTTEVFAETARWLRYAEEDLKIYGNLLVLTKDLRLFDDDFSHK